MCSLASELNGWYEKTTGFVQAELIIGGESYNKFELRKISETSCGQTYLYQLSVEKKAVGVEVDIEIE